jgi:hypothetical protein
MKLPESMPAQEEGSRLLFEGSDTIIWTWIKNEAEDVYFGTV